MRHERNDRCTRVFWSTIYRHFSIPHFWQWHNQPSETGTCQIFQCRTGNKALGPSSVPTSASSCPVHALGAYCLLHHGPCNGRILPISYSLMREGSGQLFPPFICGFPAKSLRAVVDMPLLYSIFWTARENLIKFQSFCIKGKIHKWNLAAL